MRLLYFWFIFLFSFSTQAQRLYNKKFQFKDGIYVNLKEFRANSPSIPLHEHPKQLAKNLISDPCNTSYARKKALPGKNFKDPAFIVADGRTFVRHMYDEGFLMPEGKYCFYELNISGRLGIYFKINKTNNSYQANNQFIVLPQYSEVPSKMIEFIIDLESGEVYHSKHDRREVVDIIKTDIHFEKEKIKKKDLMYFVMLYNQRHPVEILEPTFE